MLLDLERSVDMEHGTNPESSIPYHGMRDAHCALSDISAFMVHGMDKSITIRTGVMVARRNPP